MLIIFFTDVGYLSGSMLWYFIHLPNKQKAPWVISVKRSFKRFRSKCAEIVDVGT